jgi:hypothetical protein
VFNTLVDGGERETLVAWSETKSTTVDIPGVERTYDYLGRELSRSGKVELTRATVFMVLPRGGSKALKLDPPPAKAKSLVGDACPVVLQLIGEGDVKQSAFRLDKTKSLRLVAYNFGAKAARGKLSVEGATGAPGEIEIAPGGREERTIEANGPGKVNVRLDLGDAGHAIVSAGVAAPAPATEPGK